MAKLSDSKNTQLTTDVNSLNQKTDYIDDRLKKAEAKVDGYDEKLRQLSVDLAGLKGSWDTTIRIAGLVAVGVVALMMFLLNQVNEQGKSIAKLQESSKQLEEIKQDLSKVKEVLLPEILKKSALSGKAQLKQSLPEVQRLVSQVRERKVSLPLETVSKIGEGLVEIAKDRNDPEASKNSWQYAVELASYRTSLNTDTPSTFDPRTLNPRTIMMENVAHSYLDKTGAILGGTIQDYIFTNCLITFKEEGVILKNVKFINCVFVVPQTTATENLLAAILKDAAVTINAS